VKTGSTTMILIPAGISRLALTPKLHFYLNRRKMHCSNHLFFNTRFEVLIQEATGLNTHIIHREGSDDVTTSQDSSSPIVIAFGYLFIF